MDEQEEKEETKDEKPAVQAWRPGFKKRQDAGVDDNNQNDDDEMIL